MMCTASEDAVADPPRVQVHTQIAANQCVAAGLFRLRFEAPFIAQTFLPGQFVMVRLAHLDDPLIGRALAIFDVGQRDKIHTGYVDVIYAVHGKFTQRLSRCGVGERLDVWGPLGNGFPPQPARHLIMVGGGIGHTPFLSLAKEHLGRDVYGKPARQVTCVERVTLCYGARHADMIAAIDDFRQVGVDVALATNDGSLGRQGLVTDLLREILLRESHDGTRLVCCGPEPMMKAAAAVAQEFQIPAQVSLETPMACGIGICFSCVAPIRDPHGTVDYRRTCVEGPVFDATAVAWEGI